jgi:xylulose-5-phosphate/fructose-6-phosphate phosphoketolase
VRGYKERGNINTPMELAIQNQVHRFTLAIDTLEIDAIDRVPSLSVRGSHAREALLSQQLDCRSYAYRHGIDMPEITGWRWPL